jgi:hypothetical protein
MNSSATACRTPFSRGGAKPERQTGRSINARRSANIIAGHLTNHEPLKSDLQQSADAADLVLESSGYYAHPT